MFTNNYKFFLLLIASWMIVRQGISQDQGVFSGGLESNANFFMRDSLIGASGIPQYDNLLFGGEAWVKMGYQIGTWTLGLRFDAFHNSNLREPNSAYSDQGIRHWFIRKQIKDLEIQAGHIYDQIGSGIIYRAYEERPLFIDNALYGVSLKYSFNDQWSVKGFSGRQKYLFSSYPSIIKGASLDGFYSFGDEKPFTIAPGFGIVNRTYSEETMQNMVNTLRAYIGNDRIETLKYNTYAGSAYATLSYGSWGMYLEGAYKTPEVFFDPNALKTSISGTQTPGKYVQEPGSVLYASLSYGNKGLGVIAEVKRTENFDFRTSPELSLTQGLMNFIPPMSRVNAYRLTARYAPATQLLSEIAYQLDGKYSFNKHASLNINYSQINRLDDLLLYRELYTEFLYKQGRDWRLITGLQWQQYNQEIYEVKPQVPLLNSITPFLDFQYRINKQNSFRLEGQYMHTEQDFGSWIFGMAEYNVAPHWAFELSGMYNIVPTDKAPADENGNAIKLLYPTVGLTYVSGSNRYSLRYVKQVEGIVCAGGVCRLEPAFSGIKLAVSSSF